MGPWYQRFFLACDEELCSAEDTSGEETATRSFVVASGTQVTVLQARLDKIPGSLGVLAYISYVGMCCPKEYGF